MMPSRAEAIAQAIVTALTVPPMASVPAAKVRRDPVSPAERAGLPCLVVEPGDEEAPDLGTLGMADRAMRLRITAVAAGAAAHSAVDGAIIEAHGRLMADQTLGGLAFDLTEQETSRQRDELDTQVLAVAKDYRIRYRTEERSLT